MFSKTAGYYHTSIPAGNAALMGLAAQNDIEVDTTTNAAVFTEDSLKNYAAVVFLNSTGNVLDHRQEVAFERYIQSGGGFVGVHAATDTEYDWAWYGRLVGAYFESHPEQQFAVLNVQKKDHPATEGLPQSWRRWDEWYNFKKLNPGVNVLLSIDESSYKGGTNGKSHPMSWYHEYDGGRAFYTALGHTDSAYKEPQFLQHLLGGIRFAIGDNQELDFSKARSVMPPDDDRFVATQLTEGTLFEPTEMTILPNFDVLIAQRRGELMRYSEKDKTVKQVGLLPVYWKTSTPNVNAEEGLLGIAADPDFKNNNYVYLFYSPVDTSVNRLSRFVYRNDTLDLASEKVILQFYSQREICCHTGGSIAFGKDKMMYISTGDNTTPFDEQGQRYVSHGFAPLDDRPGHVQYDARRSAGNPADLRGKILRIRIKDDGTYEVPEGNLFPRNESRARPEIFVMGNRNPYRISVDRKRDFVYWGEVGPDASNDSLQTRGPRGYDEVNQARKAGFFGWPLFIGNNYAYRPFDYATGQSGEPFNAAQPVNNSRNNTGLQQLPPAQPAFIYYPYDASNEFPQVGTGGRTAMAGPVYYTDEFPKESRLPDYYNGKVFIYEWIRGWVKVVTTNDSGDFEKMEPFMEGTRFAAPVDMETGPDGRIYVLEYGSGWFAKNPDAGLVRVDYIAGNRPPKVGELTVTKTSGTVPFTIEAKVEAKDPEGDNLSYIWTIGNQKVETKEPVLKHTLAQNGDYPLQVEVVDDEKSGARSNTVELYAGNEQPQVDIRLTGNRSFYFPGKPIAYQVVVSDKGDSVQPANLFVSTTSVRGFDEAEVAKGHQQVSGNIAGKNIMLSLDCKACHKVDEKSVGPAFSAVANRYQKKGDAQAYLVSKIIKGSVGVWGETAMPAHPTLKEGDAGQIVQWILSLAGTGQTGKSLPAAGQVKAPAAPKEREVLVLQATYTDNGGAGIRPLTGSNAIHLRNSEMDVSMIRDFKGFTGKDSAGSAYGVFPDQTGWVRIPQVDLTGIRNIELFAIGQGPVSYKVEIRAGSPEGQKLGEGRVGAFQANKARAAFQVPVAGARSNELQDVYLVFTLLQPGPAKPLLKTIAFRP
ncbi:MAG TPA: ThuA domain-containing protein [Chitinophagaceae bacterium]|nr:ThuA domain-containing protein [Chitinophagaceae bacterium]